MFRLGDEARLIWKDESGIIQMITSDRHSTDDDLFACEWEDTAPRKDSDLNTISYKILLHNEDNLYDEKHFKHADSYQEGSNMGIGKDYEFLDKNAGKMWSDTYEALKHNPLLVPDAKKEDVPWYKRPLVKKKNVTLMKQCSHKLDPFKVDKDITLYCSGSRHSKNTTNSDIEQTAGVYLDIGWANRFDEVLTNTSIPDKWVDKEEIPHVICAWPDMGKISVHTLSVLALWARDMARKGHIVEVACIGSHGRTGTLLASTLIYSGYSPKKAIKEVRKRHCEHAIESKAQEDLIYDLDRAIKQSKKEQ